MNDEQMKEICGNCVYYNNLMQECEDPESYYFEHELAPSHRKCDCFMMAYDGEGADEKR